MVENSPSFRKLVKYGKKCTFSPGVADIYAGYAERLQKPSILRLERCLYCLWVIVPQTLKTPQRAFKRLLKRIQKIGAYMAVCSDIMIH